VDLEHVVTEDLMACESKNNSILQAAKANVLGELGQGQEIILDSDVEDSETEKEPPSGPPLKKTRSLWNTSELININGFDLIKKKIILF
jgi:hypothetical protein